MLMRSRLTADVLKSINGVYATGEDKPNAEELAKIIWEEELMRDRSNVPDDDADALLGDDTAETCEVEASEEDVAENDEI